MSQSQPAVSVIIPVYNVESYLRECMDSIINQTLENIEIICINDGSTDGSDAILEEYQKRDSRIMVITQDNRGLSAARNRGMEVAHGRYICFVDSDDYVECNLFEKTVPLADELELDVLLYGLIRFAESGESAQQFPASQCSPDVCTGVEYLRKEKDNKTYLEVVWKALWRNTFLSENALRFQEGILYEDTVFSLRAFIAAKRVFQIPDILYRYRVRPDSIMGKPKTHINAQCRFQCAKSVLKFALEGPYTPEKEYEIWREYTRLCDSANNVYRSLSPEEQAKVTFSTEIDNELFQQIVVMRHRTQILQHDFDCVQSSASFRIGRAITWLPRKIREGIRNLKKAWI